MRRFPGDCRSNKVSGSSRALCVGRSGVRMSLRRGSKLDGRALDILFGLLGGLGFVERREGLWQATLVTRTYLDPSGRFFWGSMLRPFRDGRRTAGRSSPHCRKMNPRPVCAAVGLNSVPK